MKGSRHLLLGALVALAWSVALSPAAAAPADAPAAPGAVSPSLPAPPLPPAPPTPGPGAAPTSSASGAPPDASSTPPGSSKPKAEVLIGSIPDLAGVLGGKVEFAKDAFPILADHKEVEVQRMLLATVPQTCSACGGDGKIGKKDTLVIPPRAPNHLMPIPLTLNWEDTCSECGGFRNRFDPKWPQRLLFLVDYLAHTARTGNFANLHARVQERLALIGENRKSTVVKQRAEPFNGTYSTTFTDVNGRRHPGTAYGVIGLKTVPDKRIAFAVNVADMVLPLWTAAKDQAPKGQTVVFVRPRGTARRGRRLGVAPDGCPHRSRHDLTNLASVWHAAGERRAGGRLGRRRADGRQVGPDGQFRRFQRAEYLSGSGGDGRGIDHHQRADKSGK
jgi:hypothetical protein